MTTAREKARELLQDAPNCAECGAITVRQGDLSKCLNCGHERNWWVVLQERLAVALLPPEGHVRVRDGEGGYVDIPLNGTLPRFADGSIAGQGADAYRNEGGGGGPCHDGIVRVLIRDNTSLPNDHYRLGEWYGSREAADAALAAREGGKNAT